MPQGTLERGDGPTIAYDVLGKGPPVVFVHGLTSRRQAWDPVTDLLVRDFTLDLRGHGGSSPAPEYSMLSLIGDVRAVVEELELCRPALIGNSLGANVAAVYACAHEASAVVCVDSSLRFGDFAALVQAGSSATPHHIGAPVASRLAATAGLRGLAHAPGTSARVEVWDGTGHLLHLVHPQRFAARVHSLLAQPAES